MAQFLKHWQLVFLSKGKPGVPNLEDLRPVAISSVLYRAWGRVRLEHVRSVLAVFLAPNKWGGVGGSDPETMVLSMDLVYGQDTHPFVMALDYRKAFDSVDQDIAVAVLRELRVPAQIVDLLSDQWSSHKRWCTIGGAVPPQPIEGALGNPQGMCGALSPLPQFYPLRPK